MTHLFLWPLSHDSVACWHFHDDTSWKSLKVTEKTPILEDTYLEFCTSIWPHIYTVGKVSVLAKIFWNIVKSENSQKYPKNEFVYVYVSFIKETCIRMRVAIYNSHVCLKYATFWIAAHVYLLVYATVVSATHVRLLKMSKNTYFEIQVVWVVMQLTPSVVTTLSSALTLHKAYK